MKEAVIAVIYGARTRHVLGAHRKDNEFDWGFPGGKVEPNEDHYDALKRELLEETGFCVINDLTYYGMMPDGEYCVHIYLGTSTDIKFTFSDNEQLGEWIDYTYLLKETNTFYNFNRELIYDLMLTGIATCIKEVQ